jgi:hypothetical protein
MEQTAVPHMRKNIMIKRTGRGLPTMAVWLLCLLTGSAIAFEALAFDESKYPDVSGEWHGTGNRWPKNPPLTPEYQAVWEANKRDHSTGGSPTLTCLPPGMPRQASVYEPMEIIITPKTVYMLIEHIHDSRRIYTDGREWPKEDEIEPAFRGHSIGHWEDTDGDGKYDTLLAETRFMKGPRTFDSTGIPLHKDNKTVVKERIAIGKPNPDTIQNEITVFDNALTRPWTITKTYRRVANKGPIWWSESICAENNPHVRIGDSVYYTSAEGLLMPAYKGQPAPDLRYFPDARK